MNSIGDNYPSYYYVGLLGTVLFVFILSLKYCCGSISIRNILKDMKVNKEKQDKYKNLFTTRESLMFHISWAKSRGDMGDARKLLIQLDELDKEIDRMENENSSLFIGTTFTKKKEEKTV